MGAAFTKVFSAHGAKLVNFGKTDFAIPRERCGLCEESELRKHNSKGKERKMQYKNEIAEIASSKINFPHFSHGRHEQRKKRKVVNTKINFKK
jgi:hypothetical protein